MRIGSLFSGYGGLDLAVRRVWPCAEVAWHVEFDAAPSAILAHHYPNIPNYGDVTQIDFDSLPPVDVLTGGYPCQPFSLAGHRKGVHDERHLWPHVRRAIHALRPRVTVLENVRGHLSCGFDEVLGEMATDGFDVRWLCLRASDVGAPHHRDRLWIVVTDPGRERLEAGGQSVSGASKVAGADDCERSLPHADGGECGCGCGPRQAGSGLGWGRPGDGGGETTGRDYAAEFGRYADAVRRWSELTRPAPAPTVPNRLGNPQLNAEFAEWMMGLPSGWVTGVPGLTRKEQLKAIGNGVCPQQGERALRLLLEDQLWMR